MWKNFDYVHLQLIIYGRTQYTANCILTPLELQL